MRFLRLNCDSRLKSLPRRLGQEVVVVLPVVSSEESTITQAQDGNDVGNTSYRLEVIKRQRKTRIHALVKVVREYKYPEHGSHPELDLEMLEQPWEKPYLCRFFIAL